MPRFASVIAACLLVVMSHQTLRAAEEGATPKPGKQVEQSATLHVKIGDAAKDVTVRYLLFLPEGYEAAKEPLPLMLFLHGSGERGDDLPLVKKHGPPKLVETERKNFPFVLISPQCPAEERWQAPILTALVEHVAAKYRVDRRRMYVTGLSMGGSGTFALLAAYPGRFAAGVPIASSADTALAPKLAGIPLWIFVGGNDRPAPGAKDLTAAIEAAGSKHIKLVVYPGVGHDAWTETYNNDKVYQWLLEQKLPRESQ